jgi:hypothetical protein
MVKKISRLLVLVLLSQLNLHCQMNPKIPEFKTEICHPNNKYPITPIRDYIKTLEGIPAGLPYGSSSGSWGSSGKSWTAQKGTPIGFEITYYSIYEDKYYEINEDFDLAYIKEMTNRCYAWNDKNSETPVKEFIYRDELNRDFQTLSHFYDSFSTLVFGFAPQGMVVVWMGYGGISIELGRFQAKEITDKDLLKKLKKHYIETYRLEEGRYEEEVTEMYIPDASPILWDNYRIKYNWNFKVTSDNKNFRFLGLNNEYFNGEYEDLLRPTLLNTTMKKRAIPKATALYWETSKNERYEGKLFFDWEKMHELLKNSGDNNTFNIHIDKDSGKIEIKLNQTPIDIDSVRIYSNSTMRFRDSYVN